MSRPKIQKDESAFWKLVDTSGDPDACWSWRGTRLPKGYGILRFNGRVWLAHRLAFFFAWGNHSRLYVCHRCDNPSCCNPFHSFAGTQQDNMQDAAQKNRTARGSRHGWHLHPESLPRGDAHHARRHPDRLAPAEDRRKKLSSAKVLDIRRKAGEGQSYGRLADEYGVDEVTIYRVVTYRTWKHLSQSVP